MSFASRATRERRKAEANDALAFVKDMTDEEYATLYDKLCGLFSDKTYGKLAGAAAAPWNELVSGGDHPASVFEGRSVNRSQWPTLKKDWPEIWAVVKCLIGKVPSECAVCGGFIDEEEEEGQVVATFVPDKYFNNDTYKDKYAKYEDPTKAIVKYVYDQIVIMKGAPSVKPAHKTSKARSSIEQRLGPLHRARSYERDAIKCVDMALQTYEAATETDIETKKRIVLLKAVRDMLVDGK